MRDKGWPMHVPGAQIAPFVISAAQSTNAVFPTEAPKGLGVAIWGSAIPKFKKRYLGLDGNTKSRNKVGRFGKDSSIACNAARCASPKKVEKLN